MDDYKRLVLIGVISTTIMIAYLTLVY